MQTHFNSHAGLAAEALVHAVLSEVGDHAPVMHALDAALRAQCGVRLRDVVAALAWPVAPNALHEAGWRLGADGVWRHTLAGFPAFDCASSRRITLCVEDAECVFRLIGASAEFSARGARFQAGVGVECVLAPSWRGAYAPAIGDRKQRRAQWHLQTLRTRRRLFRNAAAGFDDVERLTALAAADLGKDWACALFLQAEREYWAAQCSAGAVHDMRLRQAGVGSAAVEHYAYCAAAPFAHRSAAVLEALGFQRRGALHDGASSAAWVLEQPVLRCAALIEFDQDSPANDMADAPLAAPPWCAEAGLWAAMHGQSMLEGGLRYVALRCDAAKFALCLARDGSSATSTDEAGDLLVAAASARRAVSPRRIDELERAGHLSAAQAEDCRLNGGFASLLVGVERVGGLSGLKAAPFGAPRLNRELATIAALPPRRRARLRS